MKDAMRVRLTPVFVVLALLKLWLVGAQTVYAIGPAGHDDRLFLTLAQSILEGRWLGPYTNLTIVKGPMYSIWIAAMFLCGVPLLLAQHLLYVGACVVAVAALRPLIPNRSVRLLLFAVLVFNPMTFETVIMSRIIRQGIYHSTVLFIIAGFVGLYTRREQSLAVVAPWAVLAGVSLGAFWLTREEGTWLVPSIATLAGSLVFTVWRARRDGWRSLLVVVLTPFLIWAVCLAIISVLNYRYYGLFATVEVKAPALERAYGALSRVEHAAWRRYIPVPRETRERIYEASPAFAELRPFLEGSVGEGWAAASTWVTGLPATQREIAAGWFMWALRDGVAMAGHCGSAGDAMLYYARLADEVDRACDNSRLTCSGRRATMLPPWRGEYVRPLWDTFWRAMRFLVAFDGFVATPQASVGPDDLLALFRDLTHERLTPTASHQPPPPIQARLDAFRIAWLETIGTGYRAVAPVATLLAVLSYLVSAWRVVRTWHCTFLFALNTALLGAVLASIFVTALVDVMLVPNLNVGAFSGTYPLLLMGLVTTWHDLIARRTANIPVTN